VQTWCYRNGRIIQQKVKFFDNRTKKKIRQKQQAEEKGEKGQKGEVALASRGGTALWMS